MKVINPLDAAWLRVETDDTPMHVGCLQIFSPPPGAKPGYVATLVRKLRSCRTLAPPFSLKPARSRFSALLPAWTEERNPDMEHHVRHSALAPPGDEAELRELAASLYGTTMDRSRPLWECHVIEGLADGRFALFTKIHHALMDGIGGIRLLQAMLSPDPAFRSLPAPWAPHPGTRQPRSLERAGKSRRGAQLTKWLGNTRSLYRAWDAVHALKRANPFGELAVPYAAPKSVLNGPIARHRYFAMQQLSLDRVHTLAQCAGVTVNDIVLAVCAGALRRSLVERDALPGWPLVAGIPVSVRADGDMSVGTAISFALATLATDIENPINRLREIHRSTSAAKARLAGIERDALAPYTLLLMAPYMLRLMTGLPPPAHPVFNIAISNVPGPPQPLYYNGARLEAIYPMSILTHGQGLNITVLSYDGTLHAGYTACHHAVPDVARLATYADDELEVLESLFDVKHAPSTSAPRAAA